MTGLIPTVKAVSVPFAETLFAHHVHLHKFLMDIQDRSGLSDQF